MKEDSQESPVVSVVITTYNRADMLGRAIQSVLDQTYRDFELIVVDDCSTDNTKGLVRAFVDVRLCYICHDQNRRLPAARNTGMRATQGKYIAFLDDDDEWKAEKLQKQVELANAKSTEYGIISCGALVMNSKGKVIGENKPKLKGSIRSEIVKKSLSTIPSTFFFRKDSLEKIGGFDENLKSNIDHDIWTKMAQADYKTDYVDEALVIAHQHNRGRMVTDAKPRIRAVEMYLEKWQLELDKWFGQEEAAKYRSDYYTRVIGTLGAQSISSGNIRQGVECLRHIVHYNAQNLSIHVCTELIHLLAIDLTVKVIGGSYMFKLLRCFKRWITQTSR